MDNLVYLGKKPEVVKKKRVTVGVGVIIQLGQPIATAFISNRSGLVQAEMVFPKHAVKGPA